MDIPQRRIASQRWALALLLVGCLLGALAGQLFTPRVLQAQVPDSGAQRNDMIQELRAIRGKLGEIQALLKSGTVAVTVAEPARKRRPDSTR